MRNKSLFIVLCIAIVMLVAVGISWATCDDDWCFLSQRQRVRATDSFVECSARGFPVQESYPPVCVLPDGRRFVDPENSFPPEDAASSVGSMRSAATLSAPSFSSVSSSQSSVRESVFRVYFMSKTRDPEGLNCNQPYPVERRIPYRKDLARATIEGLLRGVTDSEKQEGFYTSIPESVGIKRLVIENGIATVDFDRAMEQGMGGSCRVSAVRAQIEQTLKQFPSVKEVIIAVEGRTEDVLQP